MSCKPFARAAAAAALSLLLLGAGPAPAPSSVTVWGNRDESLTVEAIASGGPRAGQSWVRLTAHDEYHDVQIFCDGSNFYHWGLLKTCLIQAGRDRGQARKNQRVLQRSYALLCSADLGPATMQTGWTYFGPEVDVLIELEDDHQRHLTVELAPAAYEKLMEGVMALKLPAPTPLPSPNKHPWDPQ